MKRKLCLICIMSALMILMVSSCGSNTDEVEDKTSPTMTELGVELEILSDDIKEFLLRTYMPVESDTKEDYLEPIANYLSTTEYESLYDDIGEYNETVETSISDLRVRYGLAENNSSNSDSILCSFYLRRSQDASTYRNKIVLTFKIQGGQITSHAIYMGQTQT